MAAAVITADIVNSTLLDKTQEKKLFQQLTVAMEPFRGEFYRGDSFQVFLKDPSDALRLIMKMRMETRQYGPAFDIRAAIGIGEVSGPVRKLGVAGGEAFVISGRALEEMPKTDDSRLLIRTTNAVDARTLELIAMFTDYIFRGMTGKQARVLLLLLDGATQLAAAKKIRKSQSTINKHVQAAGWNELSKLLVLYGELFK